MSFVSVNFVNINTVFNWDIVMSHGREPTKFRQLSIKFLAYFVIIESISLQLWKIPITFSLCAKIQLCKKNQWIRLLNLNLKSYRRRKSHMFYLCVFYRFIFSNANQIFVSRVTAMIEQCKLRTDLLFKCKKKLTLDALN